MLFVTTPPAKAGGFSGYAQPNGSRSRLKAQSKPACGVSRFGALNLFYGELLPETAKIQL